MIFGGGYTLYALNAATGAVYWEHAYPGVPGPPNPDDDSTRIFSSPTVVDGRVLFGVDEDGQQHSAGYVVAASLDTGDPVWEFQTDVGAGGHVLDDSCGSVWSSGTVLPDLGLVVFGTADCDFSGSAALRRLRDSAADRRWHAGLEVPPARPRAACDDDFGASANAGLSANGKTTFLGEGNKNGTYYSLDPATGKLRWSTNVVFGGSSGGFIGTTAYDSRRVLGATALGDFLPTSRGTLPVRDPSDPRDVAQQNPTDHAFDAATGAVLWQANNTSSFSATTVAGGMTFNGLALAAKAVQVRDASSGPADAGRSAPVQLVWHRHRGRRPRLGVGTTASANSSGIEV